MYNTIPTAINSQTSPLKILILLEAGEGIGARHVQGGKDTEMSEVWTAMPSTLGVHSDSGLSSRLFNSPISFFFLSAIRVLRISSCSSKEQR